MNESTFAELATGFALSALSAADRRDFEAALAAGMAMRIDGGPA